MATKGIGATVTKTNRATGKSTTTKKRLTSTSADEFKRGAVGGAVTSGAGSLKKKFLAKSTSSGKMVAKKLRKATKKPTYNRAKVNERKYTI